MLVHAGPHSMSAFRQGKLLADVQSEVPNVQEIRSFFVHFVRVDADACAALDAQGRKAVLDRIDRLLSYGTSQENTFSEIDEKLRARLTLSDPAISANFQLLNHLQGSVDVLESGNSLESTASQSSSRTSGAPESRQVSMAPTADVHTSTSFQSARNMESLDLHNSTLESFQLVVSTPRPGTISPWSSKASDIARICGLDGIVTRIERGVAFFLRVSRDSAVNRDVAGVKGDGSVNSGADGNQVDMNGDTKGDDKGDDIRLTKRDQTLEGHPVADLLRDRMTHILHASCPSEAESFLEDANPRPLVTIDILAPFTESGRVKARKVLENVNVTLGLALANDEIDYLLSHYTHSGVQRNPTDAELVMFAQINSEHCRHKIFQAAWTLNNTPQSLSLFAMIKNTFAKSPGGVLSAYSDNAAVLKGDIGHRFLTTPDSHAYAFSKEPIHLLTKVETHNHPTAVSPYPGASTGSGGEIRDEGAVGTGSTPKCGLVGFTTSDLNIPNFIQPWECNWGKPAHISSSLDVMIRAPLGAAAFNNEWGRPAIAGYFRTVSLQVPNPEGKQDWRGYHKPIMIAGGMGNVREEHVLKQTIPPGAAIIVLGGPGMLIGLGGGAASSMSSGSQSAALDFASVQRENPELQRRAQQVINACVSMGTQSPILSIHDVGAGGLSNAVPEIVHDSGLGCCISLSTIPLADHRLSPMEIWCNESQERYVVAISTESVSLFQSLCERERCPFAVIGHATEEKRLVLLNALNHKCIDMEMDVLFGKAPKMHRTDKTVVPIIPTLVITESLDAVVDRVLRLPCVASKAFLITIGDRSITGLVARDQMVGPWQTPLADVAVTFAGYEGYTAEAMAMGERPILAIVDAAASAQMAVAEALTNICAAYVPTLDRIRLSANWMACAAKDGQGNALYEAVKAIGMDLCPQLDIAIPVGKDSMSMRCKWDDKEVSSPVTLIVTAYAAIPDARTTLTPVICSDPNDETVIVFLDLAAGMQRLAGSALAQCFGTVGGNNVPTVNIPLLKSFFVGFMKVRESIKVLAYHDRSDGGLFTTLVEMCFAGRTGALFDLSTVIRSKSHATEALFAEELGVVIQIHECDLQSIRKILGESGFSPDNIHTIGKPVAGDTIVFKRSSETILTGSRVQWQRTWTETSYAMQALRDDPVCAQVEFDNLLDLNDPGLSFKIPFDPSEDICRHLTQQKRPKVAILRDQGVNGHVEMAFAFYKAGFESVDIHMTDLLSNRIDLGAFVGLAACGGFSYGDVLGAGSGWAKSVLYHDETREAFRKFFARTDTFALGICNGCQMLSQLRDIIPGTKGWPRFVRNKSEQFEARVCMVQIPQSTNSVFLSGMQGSQIPIAVAHGEGRVEFDSPQDLEFILSQDCMALSFVNNYGSPTEVYPFNPNGSHLGITGLSNADGRVLIMMPHPERVVKTFTNSFRGGLTGDNGPWLRMFQNARLWVDSTA